MKKMKHLALAAALLCGLGLTASCTPDERDNPVAPADQEAFVNRQQLVSDVSNDARLLADNLSAESLNVTSQALAQLMSLMQSDRNMIANIRTLFTAISQNKALQSVNPVKAGSELAQMGYLAYITADNSGFGVRVIFDGKGDCRLVANDHLEFIFPATVDGIGTTLFKLIVNNSNDCYQTVADANLPNVKRLACVSRLPKSFTMTLTALIDDKEQTLSQNVVSLQLPQSAESEYVSLDARTFQISGSQTSYLNADESTLDFNLSMDGDNMTLDYGITRNRQIIISCEAQLHLPPQSAQTAQTALTAVSAVSGSPADTPAVTPALQLFTARILNNLTLTGTITDAATFTQAFSATIQNRQQSSSTDDLNAAVESLNSSCRLQISSTQTTKPEPVVFCLVQTDGKYTIEPGLKALDGDGIIPLSQLVDSPTMESINKPFSQSFTPAGNTASTTLKFFSIFMQMMPGEK